MLATSNISTSTSPPLADEAERQLNPALRGLIPYAAFDPAGGKDMMVKGDMAAMGVGFAGRFGSELRLYLVEVRGGRWKSAQQLDELFDLSIKWRPRQIFVEENVGLGWLRSSVETHSMSLGVHLPIAWVTASKYGTGKKHERIEALHSPYKYRQILHAKELKAYPAGIECERQLFSWTPEGKGLDDFPDMIALLWMGISRVVHYFGGEICEVGKGSEPIYRSTGV